MDSIRWVATYRDGGELRQYNADGSENAYRDIDRSRLESFALLDGERQLVRYHFDSPGLRLICRRRVYKRSDNREFVFYLVGWQRMVGGEALQSISVVGTLPDGSLSVEVISKWRDNHFLFDKIEPLECETVCGEEAQKGLAEA